MDGGRLQIVLGGAVNREGLYKPYPALSDSSPLDVKCGVYITTTAVEQYFAEFALWFGLSPSNLDDVQPVVRNFYAPSGMNALLGFSSERSPVKLKIADKLPASN